MTPFIDRWRYCNLNLKVCNRFVRFTWKPILMTNKFIEPKKVNVMMRFFFNITDQGWLNDNEKLRCPCTDWPLDGPCLFDVKGMLIKADYVRRCTQYFVLHCYYLNLLITCLSSLLTALESRHAFFVGATYVSGIACTGLADCGSPPVNFTWSDGSRGELLDGYEFQFTPTYLSGLRFIPEMKLIVSHSKNSPLTTICQTPCSQGIT